MLKKPRLWVLTSKFGATSERWLYRQVQTIQAFDVRVITRRWLLPEQSPASGFSVEVTDVHDTSTSLLLRYLSYLKNWRHDLCQSNPRELRWWLNQADQDKPDVMLCHYGNYAVKLMPVLKEIKAPLVVHFHGNDMSGLLRNRRYRRRLLKSFTRLSGCVVVAEYMREWLVSHGYPDSQIRVIPCGTPLSLLSRATNLAQQPCRFLAVGRFTEKKRPDLTLRAFAHCAARCPEVKMSFVGDGELMSDCQELAAKLAVKDKVEFLGALSAERVNEEYAKASVFVQHSMEGSHGDKEGWPVSIAEAAGSGLPVISTIHASIPSQVEDAKSGFLVPEGDWRLMGERMAELANSPTMRSEMGQAARKKMAGFDTRLQVAALEAFLVETALKSREYPSTNKE